LYSRYFLREIISFNDVSKSCGFNSNAHFSRTFKEIIGVAPKEYQLNFKNKKK